MAASRWLDLLGLGDSLVDVRAEEEVATSSLLDDLIETGLVYRQVVRVPSVNSRLVEVDNSDLDVGTESLAFASGGHCPLTI